MASSVRKYAPGRPGVSRNLVVTLAIVLVAAGLIGSVLLFSGNDAGDADRVPAEVLHPPGSHTVTEASGDGVTVVEFLDYQCPACLSFYRQVTGQIEQEYQGEITFVVRNFPLDIHPLAEPAARAAEAAAVQGEFQAMYRLLFDEYESWAVDADGQLASDRQSAVDQFGKFAGRLGLDVAQFRDDLGSSAVQQRVDQDLADGEEAGVSSTPTIFVDGRRFEPTGETAEQVRQQLRDLVDEELDR